MSERSRQPAVWAVWLYRFRWFLAAGIGFLSVASAFAAARLTTDPSNRPFFARSGPEWNHYREFTGQFGVSDTVVIGIESAEGLTPSSASRLVGLEKEFASLDGVRQIIGLGSALEFESRGFGRLDSRPLLAGVVEAREDTSDFLNRRGRWPEETQHLISDDGRMTVTVILLDHDTGRADWVIERVETILRERLGGEAKYFMTGSAVEQHAFARKIEKDRSIFVALCVGVIALLLVVLHADFVTMAYSLAVMGGALAMTEGAMVLCGTRLNGVTSLLAPVILIVAVSSTVKATGLFGLTGSAVSSPERLESALRSLFVPCLLANSTTFVGFVSLLVSRIPAIQEFGIFGAAGTAAALMLTLLLAPLFESLSKPAQATRTLWARNLADAFLGASGRIKWVIPVIALCLGALCVMKIPAIETATDFLDVFKANDPFRRDTEYFQKRTGGIYALEVLLRVPDSVQTDRVDTWDKIERWNLLVRKLPGVSHVVGINGTLSYLEKVIGFGRSSLVLPRILGELPDRMGGSFGSWASPDYRQLRFTVFLHTSDSAVVTRVARQVAELASARLGPDWRAIATGETALLASMSERLVRDEVASVGTAFGINFFLILIVLRSRRYALLTVLPNIFPILGLFGVMEACGIGLNTATAMIASVAIGLMFDNTIYFLCGYRAAKNTGLQAEEALAGSLRERIQPMLASSLILAAGFGVTLFGQMVPTVQFGFLSCVTIVLTALSDLFLVPALLRFAR